MHIAITGAAGYIGSKLIDVAVMGRHTVTAIDKRPLPPECNDRSVQFIEADVTQPSDAYKEAIRRADAVIHLAAIVGAPACDKYPLMATEVNVDGTIQLLRLLRRDQRLVFPNTNSGYGTVPDGLCTEDTPLNPVSHYGKTKHQAEQYVLDRYNSISLRLATVFGVSPRMRLDLLVNQMAYEAYYTRRIGVFDGGRRRNFIHVMDVANAMVACCSMDVGDPCVYNVGNDSLNMTKQQLASTIADYYKPCDVVPMSGVDNDARDYEVSSKKFLSTGVQIYRDIRFGLLQLTYFFLHVLPADANERATVIKTMTAIPD